MAATIKTLYRCSACGEVHEDEDYAEECCRPDVEEVYACPACGAVHDVKSMAQECCEDLDMIMCPNCARDYTLSDINHQAITVAGHCNTCNPSYSVDQQLAIEDLHAQLVKHSDQSLLR